MIRGLVIAFVVVVAIGAVVGNNRSGNPSTTTETDWTQGVVIEKSAISKGGFGNVALARFTLKNTGPVAARDILVRCSFKGDSGSEISSADVTVFQSIPPGKSVKTDELNLGLIDKQTTGFNCHVVLAKLG